MGRDEGKRGGREAQQEGEEATGVSVLTRECFGPHLWGTTGCTDQFWRGDKKTLFINRTRRYKTLIRIQTVQVKSGREVI